MWGWLCSLGGWGTLQSSWCRAARRWQAGAQTTGLSDAESQAQTRAKTSQVIRCCLLSRLLVCLSTQVNHFGRAQVRVLQQVLCLLQASFLQGTGQTQTSSTETSAGCQPTCVRKPALLSAGRIYCRSEPRDGSLFFSLQMNSRWSRPCVPA